MQEMLEIPKGESFLQTTVVTDGFLEGVGRCGLVFEGSKGKIIITIWKQW
jgi:hypothetical protein